MLTADSPRNSRLQNYPWLRTEPKRRQTRRAYGHDYKAPGVYMITMGLCRNSVLRRSLSFCRIEVWIFQATDI